VTADSLGVLAVALACSLAFATTAPVAAAGAVPGSVRAMLATSMVPLLAARETPLHDGRDVLVLCIGSAATGAAFGISASIIASAAVAAGGLIDGTFASAAVGREAVFGGGAGPFGRLYALAFSAAFCSSGALTQLCARLASAPIGMAPDFQLHAVIALAGAAFRASIALAAPSIASQLFATLVAGIAARAATKVNGMMLASPLTTSIGLLTVLCGTYVTFRGLAILAGMAGSAAYH
jgi:flagellar biosynthesis protein FliR